jgi:protein gp37
MSANSKIEWTDHTFNPWIGCAKVSPGCDGCYAEVSTPVRTLGIGWGASQPRHRTSDANWKLPERWNAQAEAFAARHGRRQRVFCASLADVFDNAVYPHWRIDLWDLIEATPKLDWLLLTKRIGNAERMLPWSACSEPWPNVWIGATITSQAEADRDIPKLLGLPARVRFLSMEPLLGPVDLRSIDVSGNEEILPLGATWLGREECGPRLDWVIGGGESGPKARPMHPDWARSLRDQCDAAGVPFLFKQWGEWWPISQMEEADHNALYRSRVKAREHESQDAIDDSYGRKCIVETGVIHNDGSLHGITEPMTFRQGTGAMLAFKVGKNAAGRLLDGVQHDGFPA